MPRPVEPGRRYVPGLDGLRAVAVLAVLAYHLGFGWAAGGLLGVGVFFTLSGYLITDLLLAQVARGGIRLGAFWLGRARRLLPALFLMLTVVVFWVAIAGPSQPREFADAVAAGALYVSNWQLVFQHVSYFARFAAPTPLNHLWSLGIEEQFYLVWPLLLIVGTRFIPERSARRGRRPRLAGLAMLLAAASAAEMAVLYHPSLDPSRVYYGTDTRAFELLIGAALAMVWPSARLSANISVGARRVLDGVGALSLVVIGVLVWRTTEYSQFLYPGGFVVLTVATALVIAVLVHPAARLGRVLGANPLRWIGVRSYGIYLWHVPIIVLTTPAGIHGTSLRRDALQVAATLVVAALSWRFVEEPIRRGALRNLWNRLRSADERGRFLDRPRYAVLAGAVGLVAVAGVLAAVAASVARPEAPGELAATGGAGAGSSGVTSVVASGQQATGSSVRTSCRSVIDIGDSTSEGLTSPAYLPDPGMRIDVQYAHVGVQRQYYAISGARSIVETYDGEPNATQIAEQWLKQGYDGCWVLALGTNDAANIYVGSKLGPLARISQMMNVIGEQPVLWVNTKSLLTSGPYAEQNMEAWNNALVQACFFYPNMRVFDWADTAKTSWFIGDGIHYTTPGYAERSRLIAQALAQAFPASGRKPGCVVGGPTVGSPPAAVSPLTTPPTAAGASGLRVGANRQ